MKEVGKPVYNEVSGKPSIPEADVTRTR